MAGTNETKKQLMPMILMLRRAELDIQAALRMMEEIIEEE